MFDKGYFVFYGDFNAQQIPFYKMAHEAVHNGDLLWSFKTDLGVNFIGTYSFYLIGSPFFWLTVLFPNWLVPYLMAPLLILKFAIASLGAYSYLTKFVKNKDYALIGAILYAFSGYSLCNVFFNHFLDVVALFPVL
ncbi:YfhO family protein, partial [Akkermansia muciniphila]|uniref:YfhO family protein n=1 Tax=Akkermansia muciniphila TaxID=239935 RepID=UPI001F02C229